MKNFSLPTALAVIAGCLVVAYPAASWYTGTRIETTMNEMSQQNYNYPGVKIVKHEFKRGVFSSTEETIAEFPSGLFPKLPAGAADAAPPFQLHIINHIQHGPFPGLRVGSATIDTELVFDDTTKAQIEKIFGKQAPVQILTKLNYLGGGSVAASSPAFSTTLDDTQSKIDWKGIKLNVDFSSEYKDVQYKLDAPGLVAHMQDGGELTLGAITANSNAQRIAPKSAIYLGKTTLTLDQLKFSGTQTEKSFELQKLLVEGDVGAKDNFVDIAVKIGGQKLVTPKMTFNDFHYDYGIRHLDQQALTNLFDALQHPKTQPQNPDDAMQAALAPWKEFGVPLLAGKPEFTIDRFSVSTAEGEAKLSGKATMGDAVVDDLGNYPQLLSKLQASASISVPETMVTKLMMGSVTDPDLQAQMQQGIKQQIAMFEQQGYIVRKDKELTANLDWKQGQAMINGKPMAAPM